MHAFELWRLRAYLSDALKRPRFRKLPRADSDLLAWIESNYRALKVPRFENEPSARHSRSTAENHRRNGWRTWVTTLNTFAARKPNNPSPLQRRLDWLSKVCELEDIDSAILGLIARVSEGSAFASMIDALNGRFGLDMGLSNINDLNPILRVRGRLGDIDAHNRLIQLGLIDTEEGVQALEGRSAHSCASKGQFQERRTRTAHVVDGAQPELERL